MKKRLLSLLTVLCIATPSSKVEAFSWTSTLAAATVGAALTYTSVSLVKKTTGLIVQAARKTSKFVQDNWLELSTVAAGAVLTAVFKDELFAMLGETLKDNGTPTIATSDTQTADKETDATTVPAADIK